jgi:hypothetical protein
MEFTNNTTVNGRITNNVARWRNVYTSSAILKPDTISLQECNFMAN